MEHQWHAKTSVRRQAEAADLWLELTGRKKTASLEIARDEMAKVAAALHVQAEEQPSLGRPVAAGAAAGGLLGAAAGGGIAHAANLQKRPLKGVAAIRAQFGHAVPRPRVPVGQAALGGAAVLGGVGAALGGAYGVRRLVQHMRAAQPAAEGQPHDYLADHRRLNPEEKTAAVKERVLGYLKQSPNARAALGAGLVGLPTAGIGYAVEKHRHTPGPGGESPHHAVARTELAQHDAAVQAAGKQGLRDRLRGSWLAAKERGADAASKDPKRTALVGGAMYGLGGALAGATTASRVLR